MRLVGMLLFQGKTGSLGQFGKSLQRNLARGTWLAVRALAKTMPSRRGKILPFCGPIILVLLVLV
jgi:hypothetical protein